MAAGTTPIFTATPNFGWGTTALATANTAKDGTGTVLTCFTAGANGAFVQSIRFRPAGTNIATVVRVFINNGSTNATAGNNILRDEITASAITLSEVAAVTNFELPLNITLPAGYKVNVTVGTTISAGLYCSVVGGDY